MTDPDTEQVARYGATPRFGFATGRMEMPVRQSSHPREDDRKGSRHPGDLGFTCKSRKLLDAAGD